MRNYYDQSDEPEWGDEFDCDVVDAPDGSDAWEVRAHPYKSAEADDYANDCLGDDGYWVALSRVSLRGEVR